MPTSFCPIEASVSGGWAFEPCYDLPAWYSRKPLLVGFYHSSQLKTTAVRLQMPVPTYVSSTRHDKLQVSDRHIYAHDYYGGLSSEPGKWCDRCAIDVPTCLCYFGLPDKTLPACYRYKYLFSMVDRFSQLTNNRRAQTLV